MRTNDSIKFLLIVLTAAVIANTALSSVIALQMRDERSSLEGLANNVQKVQKALDAEIELRRHLFPQLHKSARLLQRYNPNLDYATALSYAYKIYECSDETVGFEILSALIVVESRADHRAVSRRGALGLTQVMPGVWNHDYQTLMNPYNNIEIGASILKSYIALHGLQGGLSAYKSGSRYAGLEYARKVEKIAQLHF